MHPGPVPVEPGGQRVRAHLVRPDDRDTGRRRADRHRPGRRRGLPPRLDRHLADPRDHPQALRLVLKVAPVLKVVLAGTFRRRHLGSLRLWNIALWEAAAARFRAWLWAA